MTAKICREHHLPPTQPVKAVKETGSRPPLQAHSRSLHSQIHISTNQAEDQTVCMISVPPELQYGVCDSQHTLLTVIGIPAAVVVVVVEHGLPALRVVLHDAWTNIAALLGLLVPGNEVVELCVHDEGPVNRVQVAELRVFLNADGTAGDVPQVVQADVLQAGHLEDHKGVVVEEVTSADNGEVGKERAQTVQAGYPEQQQVVSDHGQLGETQGAEDFLVDVVVVFVTNEENLEVALHHCTVLQAPKFTDVIANVDAGATNCRGETKGESEVTV